MLYVYAITDTPGGALDLPATGILPEVQVASLPLPGMTAIISSVPNTVFGEVPLRALLEDSAWTRQRVLAHEEVVAALMPQGTVLPLKFGTLFSLRDRLTTTMTHHRPVLEETLTRLRGAREWGVKIFYDPNRLRQWTETAKTPEMDVGALGAGAAFFARKQHERWLLNQLEIAIRSCVDDSHGRLARLGRAATVCPLQPPALHDRREDMVLNGAYLVAEGDEPRLRECLHDLNKTYGNQGVDFVLTGPWAPYNFTRMHLGELSEPIRAE